MPRGPYFYTVKDKQPALKQGIKDIWANETPPQAVRTNKHSGRAELRRLWGFGPLEGYGDWSHLAQVCMLERTTRDKQNLAGTGLCGDKSALRRSHSNPAVQAVAGPLGHRKPDSLDTLCNYGRGPPATENRCRVLR